ncbi:hypothetical protein GCM10011391_18880 [Pullulanibacillus camelliae]|uniref:Uncharacterized protein n=1 Tax=Pullulanibacillus camelliae TaxID=1707096 RepID=A0A8J2VSR1_9BACL|nr:hypothetical protein [Pullulanibacillus camelliae]GGE40329.1 hypothetical protein GCM10011391_18880 [Pullulanibacillus camelliae]
MNDEIESREHQSISVHPVLDKILERWSGIQKETVYLLIHKYGLPNEASTRHIIWYNNGPWKRTIVYLEAHPHNFPTPHMDYLEQTIDYKVPLHYFDDLAQFDGSLYIDRTAGEASAKCDQEAANFMALNLMHDIVTGKRNVENARRFATEIEKGLRLQGQSSPYFEKFLFSKQSHTADPDVRYF